jgi:hypothetical protein
MSQKRVRKVVTGVLCGICLAGTAALCAGILILTSAIVRTGQGNSLNLFGYAVFINDQSKPLGDYPPGTAIVVQDVPHDTLKHGDLIVCRNLDTQNQFYPVVRKVFIYDPSSPLTVTVEAVEDGEILTVNRDDVIGKCVFSSRFLGSALSLVQNQEKGLSYLALILGGLGVLFAACFLWYLLLGRRTRKRSSQFLEPEEPPDLLKLIEQVDVPLELIEPDPATPAEETVPETEQEEPVTEAK